MALFTICRKLYFSRTLICHQKIIYSKFHTLNRLEKPSFTRKILTPLITPRRTFFWIFRKQTKREIRIKDQPPDFYQLIYRNGVDHYFLVGQYCAFFMSITVTLAAVYKSEKWVNLSEHPSGPYEESSPEAVDSNEMLLWVSAFLFLVCLFYFYLSRMPMRIYYYPKKQKYLFCFYGPVPNQIKKQSIIVGDLQPIADKGFTPWSSQMYLHKSGQRLLMFENYFRHPADLYIMLGWQDDPSLEGYKKIENKR